MIPDPIAGGVLAFLTVGVLILDGGLQRQVNDLRRQIAELRGDEPQPPVSVFAGRLGLLHRLIHRGHHRTRTEIPVPSPTSPRSPA